MEPIISNVGAVVADWGPTTLISIVVILLLTGKLLAKPTVDKIVMARQMYYDSMVLAKDVAHEAMIKYYEGRLNDIGQAQTERLVDLRRIIDTQASALQVSVDNQHKLIAQQDELLDLTRTVVPSINAINSAARRMVEPSDDTRTIGRGQS